MIVVGRFGGPHGVRGWIKVQSYTEPVTNVIDYGPPFLVGRVGAAGHGSGESGENGDRGDGAWQPLELEEIRPYKNGLIVRIDGCPDRTAVEGYRGLEIGVPDDALPVPAEDEYYWRDLVGLQVVNGQGESLGRVARLMDTGAHDVMVVEGREAELLIPFVSAIVASVDMEAGTIIAEWQIDY